MSLALLSNENNGDTGDKQSAEYCVLLIVKQTKILAPKASILFNHFLICSKKSIFVHQLNRTII